MELRIFRSSKGDCLLVSHPDNNGGNSHILIDGGMKTSFKDSVAGELHDLISRNDEKIDLLCVSHIDDDHIVGVITLMELLTEWRIFKVRDQLDNPNITPPSLPEPPEIESIWHNSFAKSYDLGEDLPRVEQALHEVEQMTAGMDDEVLSRIHHKATSIKKGIILSQRINAKQLNIPLNPQYEGNIVKCNQRFVDKNVHHIGAMAITVIGPFTSDLNNLKEDWKKWEKAHRTELAEFFAGLNLETLNLQQDSTQLRQLFTASGTIHLDLGDREEVSIPNLASIMFLVEAGNRSILMTGDGHADDILKGLKKNKKLSNSESIHVDVLKIQHHGAEANIHEDFCKKVTADHYVFCGNGTHTNPEETVLDLIFNSRRGTGSEKSSNAEVDNPFTFWFSANPDDNLTAHQHEHLQLVLNKMEEFMRLDAGFSVNFMPLGEEFQIIQL